MDYICPGCRGTYPAPFPGKCQCGFTLDHLDARNPLNLSVSQLDKWQKHSSLLHSGTVALHGREEYNASYTYTAGVLHLPQLIQFTISYGHCTALPTRSGRFANEVRVAYFPHEVGSGVSLYRTGLMEASGVCVMSAGSLTWGHSFPALHDWVRDKFGNLAGTCVRCKTQTAFGEVLCASCNSGIGGAWMSLL